MRERGLGYGVALGWAVLATAALLGLATLLKHWRPASTTDLVTQGALEALVLVAVTFGVLRVHAPERPARAALGLRPTHPGLVALALGLGLVLPVVTESLRSVVEKHAPLSEELLVTRALLFRVDSPGHTLALVVVMTCLLPLFEEIFYRGALFGALCRSQSLAGATVASALAYTLSHLEWRSWPVAVLLGFVLGHVRAASGSLVPALALHIGYSAVGAVALITGVASATTGLPLSWPVIAFGWMATLGLTYAIQTLSQGSPEAEKARAEDDA